MLVSVRVCVLESKRGVGRECVWGFRKGAGVSILLGTEFLREGD